MTIFRLFCLSLLSGVFTPAMAQVASSKAGLYAFTASSSGNTAAYTLDLGFIPAIGDENTQGSIYVAALIGSTLAYYTPSGWKLSDGSSSYPYYSGALGRASVRILAGQNLTGLGCAQIYAGYGKDFADMVQNNTLNLAYTLPDPSGAACANKSLVKFSNYGMVEGYAYIGGGLIKYGRTTTPPSGYAALTNGTVSIGNVSAGTDSKGYFVVRGAAAGLQTLNLAISGTTLLSDPVMVVPDNLVAIGDPAVTRDQAIESVKAAIKSVGALTTAYYMAGPKQPLPAGTRILPGAPDRSESPFVLTVPATSWFFVVDGEGLVKFSHNLYYVLVDAASGALTVKAATSWPRINGKAMYKDYEAVAETGDLVQLATTLPGGGTKRQPEAVTAKAGITSVARHTVANCNQERTYALIVRGTDDAVSRADADRAKAMISKRNLPQLAELVEYTAGSSPTPVTDVRSKIQALYAKMTKCDTFFIYLTGHGTKPVTRQVSTEKRLIGNLQLDRTVTPPISEETALSEELEPTDLLLDQLPTCHLTTIVDACYSGAWLSELTRVLQNRTGLHATVFTSTNDSTKSVGYPKWWPFTRTGSAFTNYLSDAWNGTSTVSIPPVSSDPTELSGTAEGQAFIEATGNLRLAAGVPALVLQTPRYWVRSAAGETCGSAVSCNFSSTAVKVNAAFTNGTGSCNASSTFNSSFTLTVSNCVLTAAETGGSTNFTGSLDDVANFSLTRGSTERMSGTLQANGSGSGTYTLTNAAGCQTAWNVTFTPQ